MPRPTVVHAGGHAVAVHRWGPAGRGGPDDGPDLPRAGDTAPTVVLVHGIGVSHRSFRPLAQALADTGARVLAVDLPGFGDSPRPDGVLSVEELAEVVAAVVRDAMADGAGPDAPPPVLVGHSMGAQVVTAAATAHPDTASRLVLLGPVTEPGARSAVRQGLRLLRDSVHETVRANAVVLTDYVRCGPRRYLATVPSMLAWRLEEHLPDVTVPVVLVRGARDPIAPSSYVHALAVRAPRAEVVEVAGAGHVVMHRRPDAVVPWCLPDRTPVPTAARRPTDAPRVERSATRTPSSGAQGHQIAPLDGGVDRSRPRSGLVARALAAVRRGWWWSRDYVWVTWAQLAALPRAGAEELRTVDGVPAAPDVVLVPGVYEPWTFLRPLADRLHARGHRVHVLPALGWNRGPVPEAAALLGAYVRDRDLRDAVVVAHSKGGLIGKLAMLGEDPDGRIAGMVAIATPFGGSVYARYLPGRTLRAFSPADATVRRLGAELEVNARITSVFSRFDPHIPGGSSLAGAVNVELRTPGHFRVLADPRLDEVVAQAFDRLARPT